MTDFLERLAGRAEGRLPVVQPLLPTRHAPATALAAGGWQSLPFAADAEAWPGEISSEAGDADGWEPEAARPGQPARLAAETPPLARDEDHAAWGLLEESADDTERASETRASEVNERPWPTTPPPATGRFAQPSAAPRDADPRTASQPARANASATTNRADTSGSGTVAAAASGALRRELEPPAPSVGSDRQESVRPAHGQADGTITRETPRIEASPVARQRTGARRSLPPVDPVGQAAADLEQLTASLSPRGMGLRRAAPLSPPFAPADAPLEMEQEEGRADRRFSVPADGTPFRQPTESGRHTPVPASPDGGEPESGDVAVPAARRFPAPPTARADASAQVRVTIGRIEVRTAPPVPPAPVPPPPVELPLSLDAYLKQRSGGNA